MKNLIIFLLFMICAFVIGVGLGELKRQSTLKWAEEHNIKIEIEGTGIFK